MYLLHHQFGGWKVDRISPTRRASTSRFASAMIKGPGSLSLSAGPSASSFSPPRLPPLFLFLSFLFLRTVAERGGCLWVWLGTAFRSRLSSSPGRVAFTAIGATRAFRIVALSHTCTLYIYAYVRNCALARGRTDPTYVPRIVLSDITPQEICVADYKIMSTWFYRGSFVHVSSKMDT